jgi:hypothetical protein
LALQDCAALLPADVPMANPDVTAAEVMADLRKLSLDVPI